MSEQSFRAAYDLDRQLSAIRDDGEVLNDVVSMVFHPDSPIVQSARNLLEGIGHANFLFEALQRALNDDLAEDIKRDEKLISDVVLLALTNLTKRKETDEDPGCDDVSTPPGRVLEAH